MVAILVGECDCRTQFWKRTIQWLFHQSFYLSYWFPTRWFLCEFHPPFFLFLVGSQDHRTQFWKRVIQWPFHQSLVAIGTVVSEEKIKMWNVDGRTTDEKWWQYLRPGELKTNHSADLWQVLLYFSVGNLEHQHVTETSTTMRCPRQSIIKCQW